jgi:hypothetical protein
MTISTPTQPRRWRDLVVAGALATAAVSGAALLGPSGAGALPAGTPPTAGQTISPSSGTSETVITLGLTAPNNVCPGDTATGNFRWTTYMVPESVDPATLTYNSSGPIAPAAGVFTQPLFSSLTGAPQVNKNTAVTTGQISGTATISFAVFTPGQISPGTYEIGYACSKAGQTERFWSTLITVTASPTGGPAQIAWEVATAPPPTTTTTTTSTTVPGSTTTTTAPGSTTTTTVPGSTTTTTTVASTSTTSTTTTTLFVVPSTIRPITLPGTVLPATGSSSWRPIVIWALVAFLIGRTVMLIARPVRLRAPKPK